MKQRVAIRYVASVASIALALGGAVSAQAQSGASSDTQSNADIVVTAEKRDQRLLDVPSSITAVGNDQLARQAATNLNDVFRQVPGLNLQDSGQGTKMLVIRGVVPGGLTFGTGNTPTVGVYLDDIPLNASTALALGDSITPDLDPSDMQRIEVLKGPQGTLYGAGAMGGLLKYVPTSPALDTLSGRVAVTADSVLGNDTQFGGRGTVNVPIVRDSFGVRVGAFLRKDPGYVDDLGKGQTNTNTARSWGVNGSALWQVADNFSLKLMGLYQSRRGDDYDYSTIIAGTTNLYYGKQAHASMPGTGGSLTRFGVVGGTATLDLGAVTLSSTTSYGRNRYHTAFDLTPIYGPLFQPLFNAPNLGNIIDNTFDTKKFTEEFKVSSAQNQPLEFQAGVFYTHEHSVYHGLIKNVDINTLQPITNLPLIIDGIQPSRYEEYALFGSVIYHFTDRLSLQGGLRYAHNNQSFKADQIGLLARSTNGVIKSDEGVVTYNVTPSFKITDDIMPYFRLASGYRPGGPNMSLAGIPPTFNSDKTTNYEIGLKGSFLDKKLYLDIAAFAIDWSNPQQKAQNALGFSYFVNAAAAVSRGIEGNAQLRPMQGLSLMASAAYADAHLSKDVPAGLGIFARKGDPLAYSPKFTGNIGAEYETQMSSDVRVYFGGDYNYTSKRLTSFASSALTLRTVLPGYSLANVHVGAKYQGFDLNLTIKNVFNVRGFIGGDPTPFAINGTTLTNVNITRPRSLLVTLSKTF